MSIIQASIDCARQCGVTLLCPPQAVVTTEARQVTGSDVHRLAPHWLPDNKVRRQARDKEDLKIRPSTVHLCTLGTEPWQLQRGSTSMFLARWSAAAVEPVRSIIPDTAPLFDPVESANCSCTMPSPASGWLSGMAGTCFGYNMFSISVLWNLYALPFQCKHCDGCSP